MSFTNYLEKKILDHILGGPNYTRPGTVYVGLCTGVAEDGTITGEPAVGDYTRVAVTNNDTNWPAATTEQDKGVKSNGVEIVFPQASADWGTVSHFFVADGSSNVLLYGALDSPRTIFSGDIASFAVGALRGILD